MPVVFIAIYKSTCYSSPPDQGISTYFLYAPLSCAGTGISDLSSWIIQNWEQGKNRSSYHTGPYQFLEENSENYSYMVLFNGHYILLRVDNSKM